jgi:hypothetical protein
MKHLSFSALTAAAAPGVIENDSFLRPWEGLPDTIYARPLVKPGDKVGHGCCTSLFGYTSSTAYGMPWALVPSLLCMYVVMRRKGSHLLS